MRCHHKYPYGDQVKLRQRCAHRVEYNTAQYPLQATLRELPHFQHRACDVYTNLRVVSVFAFVVMQRRAQYLPTLDLNSRSNVACLAAPFSKVGVRRSPWAHGLGKGIGEALALIYSFKGFA